MIGQRHHRTLIPINTIIIIITATTTITIIGIMELTTAVSRMTQQGMTWTVLRAIVSSYSSTARVCLCGTWSNSGKMDRLNEKHHY